MAIFAFGGSVTKTTSDAHREAIDRRVTNQAAEEKPNQKESAPILLK
ncbi:MAG: hypothetical protein AAF065_05225 [Verrucomicrobiota bacterium]